MLRQPIDIGSLDSNPVAPDIGLICRQQCAIAAQRAEVVFIGVNDQEIGPGECGTGQMLDISKCGKGYDEV